VWGTSPHSWVGRFAAAVVTRATGRCLSTFGHTHTFTHMESATRFE